MSSSTLCLLSIALFVSIQITESVHSIYSYDDGNGGEEHCCIARIRENYCLATPITRSLIQVNNQCHQFNGPKTHRSNGKKKNAAYEDRILRRLDVKSSQEIDDKILFELKTPLTTSVLHRDLVCLTSTKHGIDLDKCYLELSDEVNNDSDDDDDDNEDDFKTSKSHKQRRQEQRRRRFNNKKRAHRDASEEDENIDDENALVEENIAEKEIRRSELHQTVRIREGRGLSILQTYTLNMTRILQTHDERDRCVSWYRKQTRKIRRNPAKHIKFCRELNDHLEDCVKNLVFSDTEKEHHSHNTIVSLAIGSKLYCEDQTGANKLLGIHRQGVLCLQAENQMVIEQKFSDIAGLSDIEKNQNVLDFIDENSKFRAEFGHDCHDTKELVEVDIADKEYQVKVKQLKTKRE